MKLTRRIAPTLVAVLMGACVAPLALAVGGGSGGAAASPSRERAVALSGRVVKRASMGIPETRTRAGWAPNDSRWALTSSAAT